MSSLIRDLNVRVGVLRGPLFWRTVALTLAIAVAAQFPSAAAPRGAQPAPTPTTPAPPQGGDPEPHVFLLNPSDLLSIRTQIRSGHSGLDAALAKLLKQADATLKVGPFSVMTKSELPPSGDKHDYLSLSRYSWPNPATPNGLPYVTRDGQINPEIYQVPDNEDLGKMVSDVDTLSLAYFLKGDEKYAARAALLLRTWFLDEGTRMNPNLQYAQLVRGKEDTSGGAVIDARDFSLLPDSIGLLQGSAAWTPQDRQDLEAWFSRYLDWLTTSDLGRAQGSAKNNLGTWYDVQVVALALFVGNRDLAAQVVRDSQSVRIAPQIDPNGRQPEETARTKSWDYSLFNLQALFRLAALASNVGVDLWEFQTPDGRGLRHALDYLIPFALQEQPWPYEQIKNVDATILPGLLREAASRYRNKAYLDDARQMEGKNFDSLRENLLYALPQ
jgi:hypothetical protein